MIKKKIKSFAYFFAVLAPMWTYIDASAQENIDSENLNVLDEVIVTARKREETLQETPVAISAFSSEALRDAGVSSVRDLSATVPGLGFTEMGSKSAAIFIRGIGQKESSNSVLDPSVGVYINGLYISRTDSQLLDSVDVESIQVMRGPQGTLFGKNTTGGAMVVTTKSPTTDEFSGTAGVKAGNLGRRDAKLFLNIPLNDDSLAMRVALSSVKRDGYMENIVDGKEFGDEDRIAGTARILWEPSTDLSADLFTYFSKQNENSAGFTCLLGNPNGRIASSVSFPSQAGTSETLSYSDYCRTSEQLAKDDKIAINKSVFKMKSELIGLTLAWNFDSVELKSITGFGHQDGIIVQDEQDGTSLPAISNGSLTMKKYMDENGIDFNGESRSQINQEFNLVGSALNDSLSYTLGLFYSQEEMHNTPFTQEVGPGGFALVNQLAGLGASSQLVLPTLSDLETETYAVYAQSTYDVTDWFQLTLGARYTSEHRERDLKVYSVDFSELAARVGNGAFPIDNDFIEGMGYGSVENFNNTAAEYLSGNLAIPFNDPVSTEKDKSWSKFTPAITASLVNLEDLVEWDSLNSGLIYFTFSKGFKAGGFEPRGTELLTFDPEEVDNYELGGKFEAFDHRLRVNGAFYYMNYKDIQVRVAETGTHVTDIYLYLSNAGDAKIQGFELELALIPVDNLTIATTLNYTDAKYKEFTTTEVYPDPDQLIPTEHSFDRSAEPFAATPLKSGSVTVSYNMAIENNGLFVPRFTATYRDEMYIGTDYLAPEYKQSTIDAYTIFSARLSWMPDDQWNVTLFVDNLTDKDYYRGGFALMDAIGSANVVKAPPRTYGLEAFYDF